MLQIGDLAERDPFYLIKNKKKVKEDPVIKFFTTNQDESGDPKKDLDPKKVKKLPSDTDSDDYNNFFNGDDGSPESVDSNEPDEDHYGRRRYYGAIPIDGFTFARKLNAASKRFLIKLLQDKRYNKTLVHD